GLSVESACGIRRPTTFGTDAAAEAFGPAETFIVTCEPRGADCPLDGDWATTVPSGWSFGTYATLAVSPACTSCCRAERRSPPRLGTCAGPAGAGEGAGAAVGGCAAGVRRGAG